MRKLTAYKLKKEIDKFIKMWNFLLLCAES